MSDKHTTTLETDRLILRHFKPSDTEAMFRNWASDPDVVRFMAYALCETLADTHDRVEAWFRYFKETVPGAWELFAIERKATGEVIGTIDYAELDKEARSAEVGYQLGKAWWGKGFAAEALQAVIKHCFETVKLNRIWAEFDIRNTNSGKVMEKAGMFYEGTARRHRVRAKSGELVSHSSYAILAEDYFGRTKPGVSIIPYERKYRDDMIFCFLSAMDAMGRNYAPEKWSKPILKEDLLAIERNYLERGDVFYLAIDAGDRVVGMAGSQTASPGDLWLKRLFVKPEWKGRGVGSKLLAAVEEHAAEKGIRTIHTRFANWYREAARFYPAKGFIPVESTEPGDYRCYMAKSITSPTSCPSDVAEM